MKKRWAFASMLLSAAGLWQLAAQAAPPEDRPRVHPAAAASASQALAPDLSDAVSPVATLQARLAAADAGLAGHHLLRSTRAWTMHDAAAAGAHLALAARHVRAGLEATGLPVAEDLRRAASYAAHLPDGASSRSSWDFELARGCVADGLDALARSLGPPAA